MAIAPNLQPAPVVTPGLLPPAAGGDMSAQQLQAYFDSRPEFRAEYERNRLGSQGTDNRTPVQWMQGFLSEHPEQLQEFNAFVGNPPDLPPDQLNALIERANAGDQQAIAALQAAGYELAADTQDLPVEQGLLQTALPGLVQDVEGDAQRRALAAQLAGTATGAFTNAANALSPEANAARLAEELRQADITGGQIAGSASTAAADKLAALQASIAAMQQNLTGDLAAKADALKQQVAAFQANLSTLDATQKAALAEQISTQQKNLEDSIAAQRNNLATEIAGLRGAADAQSAARRAALQAEIDGLTAAQAPMAQARLDSANALTTAINLGLQGTEDQLTAQRAKQGYLGTSTFTDAALARAKIGAGQQAAQAMGAAREANAGDLRTIQARAATEGRTIADELANNQLAIAGREATGGRTLADLLAGDTRTLADTGATGLATIKANTGAGVFGIDNAGAGQTFQDQVFGADQKRALADALAKGGADIGGNLANQLQGARDSTTLAKQNYFDNAYTRALSGSLAIPGLASSLAGSLNSLDNYGQSGLGRTQRALDWWATPNTAAPVTQAQAVQADNSGNQIASLGTSLLGGALKIGQANDWWKTPSTKTPNIDTSPNGAYNDMVAAMKY